MYKELIKKDTTENWNKAINFIPKAGEIIVYADPDQPDKWKIGNGITRINELPFIDMNDYFIEDEDTLVINTR